MRRYLRTAALAFGLAAVAGPATSHELGTVQVRAHFLRDGAYRIDLVVDTDQIPAAPRRPFPPAAPALAGATPDERARIESFLAELSERSHLEFDGRRAIPETVSVAPDAPPLLRMTLSGLIPAGARAAQWHNEVRIGSYVTSFENEGDEAARFEWLDDGKNDTSPFALGKEVVPLTRSQVARLYLSLGVTHIVPHGTDHILFVLGIFLLSRRLKEVLWQVTAFTIAHTITLGLTIYGLVSLSPRIVEPAIALSIVYVAIENVLTEKLHAWRVAVVFCFGLLHGMGFAGVLREVGLPRSEFLTGLVSFNVGVEFGQLTVILSAYLAVGLLWSQKPWYRRRVAIPASLAIAAVGLYWAAQRLAS
jgi:hydrogenase/urease accessory protein HupE